MPNLFDAREIPLHDQKKEVARELRFRRYVYPPRVASRRMTQAKADQQIKTMEAVLESLERLEALEGQTPEPRPS